MIRYRLKKEEKDKIKKKYRDHPLYLTLNDSCKQFERKMPGVRFSPEEVFVLVIAYIEEITSNPEEARSLCERIWDEVYCGIRDESPNVPEHELDLATCVVLYALYFCLSYFDESIFPTLAIEIGVQMNENYSQGWQEIGERFQPSLVKRGTENLKKWLLDYARSSEYMTDEFERLFQDEEEMNEIREVSSYRIAEKHKTNFAKIIVSMYELHMFEDETGKIVSNKQKLVNALGGFLGMDYKNLSQLLNAAKQNGNYTEIFDKLKEKAEKYDQK